MAASKRYIQHHPSPHDHPFEPDQSARRSSHRRLKLALMVALVFVSIEIIGSLLSGSLALLADAAHMLADSLALGVSLLAGSLAERLRSKRQSYGFYRLEVLAALFNGLLLLGMALFIALEAYERLLQPQNIDAQTMLGVAIIGLLANLFMLKLMAHSHRHNMNTQAAFFHILGDTLSSVAVIVGAIIILYKQIFWPDVFVSFFVAAMISLMSFRILRDSCNTLLEATPKHMDPEEIQNELRSEFSQIVRIHDFHVWEITSHLFAMTAHVEAKISSLKDSEELINKINFFIREKYGIGHTTFQIETTEPDDSSPSIH